MTYLLTMPTMLLSDVASAQTCTEYTVHQASINSSKKTQPFEFAEPYLPSAGDLGNNGR